MRKQTEKGIHSNRIEWVDFAKACTILLTIVGHCVLNSLRGVIFSFHMPMFFFLSAVTMRCSSSQEELVRKIKKDAKHLLLPALIVWILCMARGLIVGYVTFADWKEQLFSLVFASGNETEFAGMKVPALGMVWFLIVLFMVRTIFDYLHMKLSEAMLFVVSMLCGILGVMIGTWQFLPLSFDITLAVMPFFYFGYWYGSRYRQKQGTVSPNTAKPGRYAVLKWLIWPVVWLFTLYLTYPDPKQWTYLELSIRRYTLFPVCYLCAAAGIMTVIGLSMLCCKLRYVKIPMLAIGKNCLYLYMIHMIDFFWYPLYTIEGREYLTALARIGVDLAFLVVLVLAKKGIGRWLSGPASR